MPNLLTEVRADFCSFNIYDKILLLSTAALFLPYQFASAILLLACLFFAVKGKLGPAIASQTGRIPLYLFIFLELAVSLYWHNWIGLGNAAGYLLGAVYIALYRQQLTPRLFHYLLVMMILMSWLAAFYGLYEFKIVSERKGYDFWDFVVQNRPKDRINSTFKNANFYATMCDFFILFCVYASIQTKSLALRLFYILTALLNFFMMFLTGCRTAFLPFFFIFPLFFGLAGKKKLFWISCILELAAVTAFLIHPDILPRMGSFKTFNSRIKIWKGALFLIRRHPLFGMGPQTYGFQYAQFGFHKAPHAHNIFLDSLCSFGISGTILLWWYLLDVCRQTVKAWREGLSPSLFALIISFVLTALVLGLLDCTLNFVVTGITFMMVFNSACLFKTAETR